MSSEHSTRRTAPTSVTIVSAATTGASLGVRDQYITVTAVGGSLYMVFGDSNVAAADSNDWPLAEGEKESFYIGVNSNYVSISGTGALRWYAG